jgi:hypothetical protein
MGVLIAFSLDVEKQAALQINRAKSTQHLQVHAVASGGLLHGD